MYHGLNVEAREAKKKPTLVRKALTVYIPVLTAIAAIVYVLIYGI